MNIRITGRLGATRAEPERAEVSVGETVQWTIGVTSGRLLVRSVAWELYFEGRTPFLQRSFRLVTAVQVPRQEPPFLQQVLYTGQIIAGEAIEPGEYKYGVRTVDEATGNPLGDDDPYLIVRPRR